MAKELKLKVKKFWGLIPTFVEVTEEKLVGMAFLPSPLILNGVNLKLEQLQKTKKTLKFILFDNYFPDLWLRSKFGIEGPSILVLNVF